MSQYSCPVQSSRERDIQRFVLFFAGRGRHYLFAGSFISRPCNRLASSMDGLVEPRAMGRTKRSLRIFWLSLAAFFSSNKGRPKRAHSIVVVQKNAPSLTYQRTSRRECSRVTRGPMSSNTPNPEGFPVPCKNDDLNEAMISKAKESGLTSLRFRSFFALIDIFQMIVISFVEDRLKILSFDPRNGHIR